MMEKSVHVYPMETPRWLISPRSMVFAFPMKPLVQFLSNKIGFRNYGTLETTQLVVSYALRYRQKPSRKAQRKCGKHDAAKTRAMHFIRDFFWGEAPSRTACKQCLHSAVCDETYLGCTMAVSQNEPKKN